MKYVVVDRKTNEIVGTYKCVKKARRKRDKLDNEYGSYRYTVKEGVIQ